MRVTAVIPAYNEREELPRAVQALREQTCPPDLIVVALNNAADGMLEVAASTGALVADLGKCPNLKAEALNKLVEKLLPSMDDHDALLVADADSSLAPTWIETAKGAVDEGTVVGGIFLGEPGGGWLGRAQRNEYRSYSREVYARRDRAWVLTGTGTMFAAAHARRVIAARGRLYDEQVSTEDFELTVQFKKLGLACVSPRGCEVTTEVMPTVRQLHDQRVRWYRGAVETLRLHGVSRVTAPYLVQQAKIVVGLTMSWTAMALTAGLAATDNLEPTKWWLVVAVPVASKVVSGQHRWFSAAVVPELVYDVLLQRALLTGWWKAFTSKSRVWNATEGGN